MSMESWAEREDNRALDDFMKNKPPRKGSIVKRKGMRFVANVSGNLAAREWLGFYIFERGEIAALAGLDTGACPFSRCGSEVHNIWMRGWAYGDKQGVV